MTLLQLAARTTAPYERAISPNERLYLAGRKLAPPFCIQLVVEGVGPLVVSELEAAMAIASEACPGSRLVMHGDTWVDTGRAPPVRTVDGSTWDRTRFSDASFLRDALDPRRGPTCELLVVTGEPSTLVFRAFHGVMDGKGVLLWMGQLFCALRGETPREARSTWTDAQLLRERKSAPTRAAMRIDQTSPLGSEARASNDYFWRRARVPGNPAALVSKLAALLGEGEGVGPLRFMIPVDLRRHDPTVISTANLSLPIFIDTTSGEGWESIHERLLRALGESAEIAHDPMSRMAAKVPIFALAAALRATVLLEQTTGRFAASALLSHLGKVSLDSVSGGAFQARTVYSLPLHVPLAGLAITAVEVGDNVELVVAAPAGSAAEEAVDIFLAKAASALSDRDDARSPEVATFTPFPSDATLVDLFVAQVARTPNAVALVEGARQTTYEELDVRSTVFARQLCARGVASASNVGLMLERTTDAIVAILGVLKAGAAYVPLDPKYPIDRIATMLDDAHAVACVTHSSMGASLHGAYQGEVVHVDAEADETCEPLQPPSPNDRAYILYTSGSTGRPKGVPITHRNLVSYVHWAIHAYGVGANTRFALFTSLSFDLSVTSFLVPLLAGGSVALFPEDLDHVTLRSVLVGSGVTALKVTPSHLDLMSRLELRATEVSLVVVGGEQLRGAVALRAQRMFGQGCRIFNEYGPTETTVGCVFHRFDAATEGDLSAVPIGAPAFNVQIHLLGADGRRVRRGEVGEIFISGEGVAPGYWRRDELTAERFAPLGDGVRAYRTGDRARTLPNGDLEYLGRTDDQVKVRGFRIELGEIRSLLAGHPGVEGALVVARAHPRTMEPALCAYVVLDAEGARTTPDALKAFLASKLPLTWVPSFMIEVAAFPLNVNGKVDVHALPDPTVEADAETGRQASSSVEEASDEVAQVAAIWKRVLKLDARVLDGGADFHRLGGDSLQMLEMLAAVAQRVVGPSGEAAFMAGVRPLLRMPTLENVTRAAALARRADV